MSSSPRKFVTYGKKSKSRSVVTQQNPRHKHSSAELPPHGQKLDQRVPARRISESPIQVTESVEKTWASPSGLIMTSTASEVLRSDRPLPTLASGQMAVAQVSKSGTSKLGPSTTGRLLSSAPPGTTGDTITTSKKSQAAQNIRSIQTGTTSRTLKENMAPKARLYERSNVSLIN